MTARRYLEFVKWATGETARRVEVTGKSERQIERIMMGMLTNIHEDWGVRRFSTRLKRMTSHDRAR